MRMVYSSTGLAEVSLMRGLLEGEGITSEMRGENIGAMVGAVINPSLWVADPDVVRALEIVESASEGNSEGQAVLDRMEAAEDLDGTDDEAGQETMSELFLVADRLWHDPFRADLMEELGVLSGAVTSTGPPFGIEDATWNRVGMLARDLIASQEVEDEEVFRDAAHALRDFLREYI